MAVLIFIFASCSKTADKQAAKEHTIEHAKGKLFIIGGGKRPPEMIKDLIRLSGIDSAGYAIVLPMASEFIDTASYYSSKQFKDQGIDKVYAMNFQSVEDMTKSRLDSVKNASLLYISGGDQNRFMKIVLNTPLYKAMHEAYRKGAVIAGTSAGAAVMSKKMITGNEKKHPEYTGNFRTIEANNIEIGEGMGFSKSVIVDQHFIWRMRMNRLISTSLENPMETCIGIDESTAILVDGDSATVYGNYQVITLKHKSAETKIANGLLGGENLELNVYLPGDKFLIEK
jgi:cyanophycinase